MCRGRRQRWPGRAGVAQAAAAPRALDGPLSRGLSRAVSLLTPPSALPELEAALRRRRRRKGRDRARGRVPVRAPRRGVALALGAGLGADLQLERRALPKQRHHLIVEVVVVGLDQRRRHVGLEADEVEVPREGAAQLGQERRVRLVRHHLCSKHCGSDDDCGGSGRLQSDTPATLALRLEGEAGTP